MIDIELVESSIDELENGNINYEVCRNLAALYAVRDEYYRKRRIAEGSTGSEFMRTVSGKNVQSVLLILDELMDAVKILNYRTYTATLDELKKTEDD